VGSHFVRVYSVDDVRVRAALGSGDRKPLNAWLRAIRKQGGRLAEDDIEAQEEAAEKLIAGGVPPGARSEGRHFGYAFLALCGAWADRQAVVECYVAEAFRPCGRWRPGLARTRSACRRARMAPAMSAGMAPPRCPDCGGRSPPCGQTTRPCPGSVGRPRTSQPSTRCWPTPRPLVGAW
jgi:hypothetical protein